MWKPLPKPGEKPPFNEIAHLNAETLKFVLNLRTPTDTYEEWLASLSEEERKVIEEGSTKKVEKVCNRTDCKKIVESISVQLLEKAQAEKKIKTLQQQLHDIDESYNEAHEALVQVEGENNELVMRLDLLKHREKKELKEKSHTVHAHKASVEHKIRNIEAEIDKVLGVTKKKKSSGANDGSDLVFDHSDRKGRKLKHNGVYGVADKSGFKKWSCCEIDDVDHEGCIDDHSVGIKSDLVVKDAYSYKPHKLFTREMTKTRSKLHHNYSINKQNSNIFFENSLISSNVDGGNKYRGMPSVTLTNVNEFDFNSQNNNVRFNATLSIDESGVKDNHASFITCSTNVDKEPQSKSSHSHRHGSHHHSYALPPPHPNQYYLPKRINSGSILALSKNNLSRPLSVGRVRSAGEAHIHRMGGRPLTAAFGAHLLQGTTSAPSSCLSHISHRIV